MPIHGSTLNNVGKSISGRFLFVLKCSGNENLYCVYVENTTKNSAIIKSIFFIFLSY